MCISQASGHVVITLRTETGHFHLQYALSPLAWTTGSINATSLINNCIKHPRIPKKDMPPQTGLLRKREEPPNPPLFLACFSAVNNQHEEGVTVPPVHSAGGEWVGLELNRLFIKGPKCQKPAESIPLLQGQGVTSCPSVHRCGGWNELVRPPAPAPQPLNRPMSFSVSSGPGPVTTPQTAGPAPSPLPSNLPSSTPAAH